MKTRAFIAALASLATLSVASASFAQSVGVAPPPTTAGVGSRGEVGGMTRTDEARENDRIAKVNRDARRSRGALSPEDMRLGAAEAVAAAGLQCTIGDVSNPGQADAGPVYEVSCADGPGLLLVASTPPATFNCLALDVSVANGGDPTLQCALPANKDAVAATRGYARTLGVSCAVDEAAWIGRVGENADRYELGCSGADGYWVEVDARGVPTSKLECLEVARAGATCRFTTAEDQAAGLKSRFQGTPAAPCDVVQARFVGANADYRFYEAKCAADGGLIARFKLDGTFDEGYPCADAAHIAGGCTLSRPEEN